ncbi:MAG: preprotein translocase subunit SecY, partial [Clostridia bacterium]|nr:preprotein translocase subunit SecY [Clostridia bacterium]
YLVLFVGLIIGFSYFYIIISFDPVEVSNNLKQNGGSIPGIRPGESTAKYIKKILDRITFLGAIFLAVIAGIPLLVSCLAWLLNQFEVTTSFFGAGVLSGLQTLSFGGSSLLIVIGVALETYRLIEAQMSMRHYKGFLQ